MRFVKMTRYHHAPVTPRRLACASRALAREREASPLLASIIATDQPTPQERLDRQETGAEAWIQQRRDFVAKQWRRGRAMLRSLPPEQQAALLAEWDGHRFLPGTSEYFADFVTNFVTKKAKE